MGGRRLVLIAPDKFKGCLTAAEVVERLGAGIGRGGGQFVGMPLADGGDGSVDAAVAAGADRVEVTVADALGRPHRTEIAFDGETAVVEVANTCGLTLLGGDRAPLAASSAGMGQAARAALRLQPRRVVLAVGGSASIDGGAGLLGELGVVFEDDDGPFVPNGGTLQRIRRVRWPDSTGLDDVELVVATDVGNPLLGPDGAAAVFAPQKGATPVEVGVLEGGLSHLVDVLASDAKPGAASLAATEGAGSGGGIGFAALLLGARQTSGADLFLDLLGFDDAARDVDLIVTGEGSLDDQTGRGKLVAAVLRRAGTTPVVATVGRVDLTPEQRDALGLLAIYAVSDQAGQDTSDDSALTGRTLEAIGAQLAKLPVTRPTGDRPER